MSLPTTSILFYLPVHYSPSITPSCQLPCAQRPGQINNLIKCVSLAPKSLIVSHHSPTYSYSIAVSPTLPSALRFLFFKSHRKTCIPIFTAAPFTIAKMLETNQVFIGIWLDKQYMAYTYNEMSFIHKKYEILIHSTTWMNPENIMLNEIS